MLPSALFKDIPSCLNILDIRGKSVINLVECSTNSFSITFNPEKNIIIIDKNSIDKYLNYTIEKYGKDFINLYEKVLE